MNTRRTFLCALAATRVGFAQGVADFYMQLVRANDDRIKSGASSEVGVRPQIRRVGTQLESLTAAYCTKESEHFQSATLLPAMEELSRRLVQAQHSDGTIDSGNLNSPPDTGFVLESACTVLAVLRQKSGDQRLSPVAKNVEKFILAAAEAQVTGGVHTPNHRWVICSALARIHSLFPSQRYVNRIDDWLGEGIDIDSDGQYSERSPGIYSQVTDSALITMARLLNRPQLLVPVRRNLEMTLYFTHPDGEVETVASRRQDQWMRAYLSRYYVEYRYMAVRDRNPQFAAATRMIEQSLASQVKASNPLLSFLEEPLLRQALPEGGEVPKDYSKPFPKSRVVRVRRNQVSATVNGGSDWPMGVGSGLASNPTFFTFRKGKAVLESVRMACNFFSEGVFRSEGLLVQDGAFILHQRFDVPYYQPLPASERNTRGDYPLTPAADERFWSKLNFPNRPVSNVQTIDQKISVKENGGKFELRFDISGHAGVPVTIELGFRGGGVFEGEMEKLPNAKQSLLKSGMAKYTVGEDSIEFGPGEAAHRFLNLEGSSYTAHGGKLPMSDYCVYITGLTPLQRVIRIG